MIDHPSPIMHRCFFLLAILPLLASAVMGDDDDDNLCVYTVFIRTGSVISGGTDATIGLTLGDAFGREFSVQNLTTWGGLVCPDHDYFERGALDTFTGRGPCSLHTPICRLNLTSDGTGEHHGWFCDYVEVTTTGPHIPCSQTLFYVQQWLATDAPPFNLYATVDGCTLMGGEEAGPDQRRLVVGGDGHTKPVSEALSTS